jgi:hypothetical protein
MNKFTFLNSEIIITKIIEVEVDNGLIGGKHKFKNHKSYDLEGNPIPGLKCEDENGKIVEAAPEFDIFFTEWIKENDK